MRSLTPLLLCVPLGVVVSCAGTAQERQQGQLITEARVTEVIRFLASDELAGRGTPSAGLDKAAAYIAEAFARAGLRKVGEGENASYFHTYECSGLVLESTGIKVVLYMDQAAGVELEAGADVRMFRPPAAAFERDDTDVVIVEEADAARRLRRSAARNPVLILVDPETSQLWRLAATRRHALRSRRFSRAPVLLVRKGAMPKGVFDHAEVVVPAAKKVTLELRNVVGVLPGTTAVAKKKGEYVVFSAHYDHLGISLPSGGDGIYNGADDDGSGTTAVVTLAEAYARAARAGEPCERNLMFVCFSGEEKGLLGSRAFVEDPPVPLKDIAVNFNIEMIGRPEKGKRNCAWITGREYSDFEEIARVGFDRADIECIEFRMARRLFTASDNAAFARRGVVAHSISAGSLHEDYHRVTDQVEKLDLPHMTQVIRGLYEAGREFANRAERPQYNEQGRRALRLDR